ncbi:unnamed protein product [Toxocara canis]|uniref:Microtubule-associated protein Jupiter n=1 Tax=Toxocara canis TaxID=6265 RepID=A0A183UYC4_TOXCA|nr:unnamed protein product [Toxocara canis]
MKKKGTNIYVKGEAKSLPSAWTKGAPDLASDKGAQNAKKHPIKTLPVSDVWCDRSAELQMTEKGQASTVLPAGLGAPPGLGVQPGLAPPPGFGPPPGFEAPSVSAGSAVIKASGSSPSPSLNDKWVAVPKKGKK